VILEEGGRERSRGMKKWREEEKRDGGIEGRER
jgi:hypothetical protein